MMMFVHSGTGAGFLTAKQQVFPVDYEADVSHRLLDSTLSGDLKSAFDCIHDPYVDVNFVGAVSLKFRTAEVQCGDESENVVRFEYQEFKSDVTALFVAVHTGNVTLVRKLLSRGADVNQKLFRGFSLTAAVREGHLEIFEILLKAGASQQSCEEALLEASCHGRDGIFIELLMASDLIRPNVAVHALVIACCRGFIDVVDVLLKCGVDINASARVLLCSSKPSLHTNINCTPLVAAVVSRQVAVVRQLLQAGANVNMKVQLGAWSWDTNSGDEFRVGAGLAEPYPITWCAVEYFEATGSILQMLLQRISPATCHNGRSLLHHAVLCGNTRAVNTLLKCGSDIEHPVKTTQNDETRPVHMAARLGYPSVLQLLIDSGCDINSRTKKNGETALMICARFKQEECLRGLTKAGADLGLTSLTGQSAQSIAESNCWFLGFEKAVLDTIRSGTVVPASSNTAIFSPLMFVAHSGDIQALKALISRDDIHLDEQDENGFSALMVTATRGDIEAFRLLVYAGCDVKLTNKAGETAISLSKMNENSDMFEKVMIEFTLEKGSQNARGFYPLHYAARHGDTNAVKLLTSRGYDVNIPDGDGYTPLMLAARENNGQMCELLISCGSVCGYKNSNGETALLLARKHASDEAEGVILDELARVLVLSGGNVLKHTKGGRGSSHVKELKMTCEGVLRWGNSSRRNVVCRDAEVGPSVGFVRRRGKKGDGDVAGVFRVVTVKKKEVHFVCDGGLEMAKLWIRGIKLVTREAIKW
ncbi:putative ankyrin repeat-containing domain-containing protein [Helianthus annuus]|uniref:Ankyrin repeat-containing domain-containing protein n=1 Tax=Helianthus annuus TaxID=4232 RepID=A0A251S781_HELAN|nr:ankyrin-1 [Helianthus annuus]KAF5763932.1 putative ankyrin repeat-containing domain-containing protein [Helianthus annuus]KAJ0472539.1 putative ankyrin repeat-containing domain-containing protein [Helianthus annuus]KAJ0648141.1 putative ankyrin repeat-containing domain-containing protein [Helianthus annuus]KAJ0651988.1 putative ankyrin repeat-containing domain-containing protein [Helianthus annuus]KAJ0830681.1 putative ankyrin repeat-containing domain-containing protein [Helianthus annuus]